MVFFVCYKNPLIKILMKNTFSMNLENEKNSLTMTELSSTKSAVADLTKMLNGKINKNFLIREE